MTTAEEFEQAGLYDPVEHATNGRLELLNWLSGHGFTIAEMVAGLSNDILGALASDRRVVPGERLTRRRAIEISGLSAEDFDSFTTAFGFVRIDDAPDGEIGFTSDEAETIAMMGAISSMFSPAEAAGFVRVVGSSLGRISEAAVSLFLADVESPLLDADGSELDFAMTGYEAAGLLDGFTAQLDPVMRRHILQSTQRSRRATISYNERLQYRYAVGFVDLVGFTEISSRTPAPQLAAFIRDFEGRAHNVLNGVGARLVKLIGDEVMFVADDANAACRAANALMSGFGLAYERVMPRGGLAYGDVLVRGGDYYGSVVNLASRLVDEAVPQELLVTSELMLAATDCRFEPAGRRMVKGFADPVVVHSLMPDHEAPQLPTSG